MKIVQFPSSPMIETAEKHADHYDQAFRIYVDANGVEMLSFDGDFSAWRNPPVNPRHIATIQPARLRSLGGC